MYLLAGVMSKIWDQIPEHIFHPCTTYLRTCQQIRDPNSENMFHPYFFDTFQKKHPGGTFFIFLPPFATRLAPWIHPPLQPMGVDIIAISRICFLDLPTFAYHVWKIFQNRARHIAKAQTLSANCDLLCFATFWQRFDPYGRRKK